MIGRVARLLAGLLAALALMVLASYVNHRVKLAAEDALFVAPGQLVEVAGALMHVYSEGAGSRTLVFMAGGGTSSPTLDFRSLYTLLSHEHRVVVVEKAGYGFSEVTDSPRDVRTLLSETRAALAAANIEGPFVLVPHSMSALEALHWVHTYPTEVEAIVGLDMAVPNSYEDLSAAMPLVHLGRFAAVTGLIRWLPGAADSAAIRHGTLSEEEQTLYRTVFYRRTATRNMVREAELVNENAAQVRVADTTGVPMLLFASNGEGTGWSPQEWVTFQREFVRSDPARRLIELDASHYVHNVEPGTIAAEVLAYLQDL